MSNTEATGKFMPRPAGVRKRVWKAVGIWHRASGLKLAANHVQALALTIEAELFPRGWLTINAHAGQVREVVLHGIAIYSAATQKMYSPALKQQAAQIEEDLTKLATKWESH